MNVVSVKAEKRQDVGSKSAKLARREGKIPCVLYGGDKVDYFTVVHKQVKALIYTPEFKIAEIELDGVVQKCIVKDLQMHPVTDAIVHIDFLRLVDGVKVKVELPLGFKGESPGVKGGGKLIQNMRTIKIKTTPDHLVDRLYVSIEGLLLGNSVRVKDVEVTEEMEVLSALATPVAQVAVPRALKSLEDEEAEAAEAAAAAEGGEEAAEGGEESPKAES